MRFSTVIILQILATAISANDLFARNDLNAVPSDVTDFINSLNDAKKFPFPSCFPSTPEQYVKAVSCRALDGFKLMQTQNNKGTTLDASSLPTDAMARATCFFFAAPEVDKYITNCANEACKNKKDIKIVEETLKSMVKYATKDVCPNLVGSSTATTLVGIRSNSTTEAPIDSTPESGAKALTAPLIAGLLAGVTALFL